MDTIGLLNSILNLTRVSIAVFFSGYNFILNSSVFLLLSINFTKSVSLIIEFIESYAVNDICKLSVPLKVL